MTPVNVDVATETDATDANSRSLYTFTCEGGGGTSAVSYL